jgi:transposase
METRQVKGALKAMPIKTDRRDAEGIARLLHLGWFRPVHCKRFLRGTFPVFA